MSPVSPLPSEHTQLMTYKLAGGLDGVVGGGDGAGFGGASAAMNHGFFGPGIHGGAAVVGNGCGINGNNNNTINSNSNHHHHHGLFGGSNGVMMGPGGAGTLDIVSGDYIDLNELLSMNANGCHDEDNSSMVA